MINELDFQIAFGAVKHFGRNLYTTNPPAIAELVANAWDAYATNCLIYYNDLELLIIDNGIGMTDQEFQERYAKSGYEKDFDIRKPDDMKIRPYMGKKGIGKFSAFSLADTYHLFTKSNDDDQWKQITLEHDILNTKEATVKIPIKRIQDLHFIEEKFGIEIDNKNTGTIIYLPNLRRQITAQTTNSLNALLPRRFSVTTLINDGNFHLHLQGNEINLKTHFYFQNIEYMYYFGFAEEEIKKLFPNIVSRNIIHISTPALDIKGWIASVNVPANLKTEDGTKVTGVAVYINGKIADENIFKNVQDDRIPNSYIIGEVDADYLEQCVEDPVLSSREGLNHELPEVIELRRRLENLRNDLIENWNAMRARRDISKQEYIQKALEKPEYAKYYFSLGERDKEKFNKYAQRLFDKPKIDDVVEAEEEANSLIDLIFPAILQLVNDEALQKLLKKTGMNENEALQAFADIFNFAEINHALRMRANVLSKLKIIEKLKEFIFNGEVEKVFERHLAQHPWLIEPYWNAQLKNVHTQDYHKLLNIDNTEQKLYIDLIIEVAGEINPIIVEIKREKATNYSVPDVNTIINQIYNYQKALVEKLKHEPSRAHIRVEDIKAFFICGDQALSLLTSDDRNRLEKNGITIKSYDILIKQAEMIYSTNFGLQEDT